VPVRPTTYRSPHKTQCNSVVQDLSLTVTIIDTSNMHVVARTEAKKSGSAWIENESTWFTCKNTKATTYQGLARGISLENGRLYEQLKAGNAVQWNCGY
jgi:hypothetical protein